MHTKLRILQKHVAMVTQLCIVCWQQSLALYTEMTKGTPSKDANGLNMRKYFYLHTLYWWSINVYATEISFCFKSELLSV